MVSFNILLVDGRIYVVYARSDWLAGGLDAGVRVRSPPPVSVR